MAAVVMSAIIPVVVCTNEWGMCCKKACFDSTSYMLAHKLFASVKKH